MIKIKTLPSLLRQLVRIFPWKVWLAIITLGVFFWLWIFGHHGLAELENLRKMKWNYLKERNQLQAKKVRLEKELKYLQDKTYLKHIIHKELGYIEKGEAMILLRPKK